MALPNKLQQAITAGGFSDAKKHHLYDRYINVAAGAVALAGATYVLFNTDTVNTKPENTNMLEIGRMGVNEEHLVEAIELQLNPRCTDAGIAKFFQEARLEIYTGPENILRARIPLTKLTTLGGLGKSGTWENIARNHTGVWRISGMQRYHLRSGNPFKVQIVQGPNAPAFAAGDTIDFHVYLDGAYKGSRDL